MFDFVVHAMVLQILGFVNQTPSDATGYFSALLDLVEILMVRFFLAADSPFSCFDLPFDLSADDLSCYVFFKIFPLNTAGRLWHIVKNLKNTTNRIDAISCGGSNDNPCNCFFWRTLRVALAPSSV